MLPKGLDQCKVFCMSILLQDEPLNLVINYLYGENHSRTLVALPVAQCLAGVVEAQLTAGHCSSFGKSQYAHVVEMHTYTHSYQLQQK